MNKKLFGTDGIRGKFNQYPLTEDIISKIGMGVGYFLQLQKLNNPVVLIGKDTRESGDIIETILSDSLNKIGINVLLVGCISTPAIAFLTKSFKCNLGIVISASHNPYYDNGIKIFNSNAIKLSDDIELYIENLIETEQYKQYIVDNKNIGITKILDNLDCQKKYIDYLLSVFSKNFNFDNVNIVVDCANGVSYQIAPYILKKIGIKNITVIGDKPNGININEKYGSTDTALLCKTVIEKKADIGIAFDGDADRIIVVDEKGTEIDGDKIIALLATEMLSQNKILNNTVVVTQMSNLGLELYLKSLSLNVVRTKVGDRYIIEEIKKHNYNFGGEQSGHIILGDYSTTGDGVLTALYILYIMKQNNCMKSSKLFNIYDSVPQILKNITYDKNKSDPLEKDEVKQVIHFSEEKLKNIGRVLIRKSGTQPIIRVMVECKDSNLMEEIANNIVNVIQQNL